MTTGPATGPAGSPGLRATRASLTPATLIAPGPGHLVLRTAGRGDFREGNALHVDDVLEADAVDRWVAAFAERLGHLAGVEHVLVRWETDVAFADAGTYAARLRAAAAERGLALDRLTVMELAGEPRALVPLTEGIDVVRAARDEQWWGVRALRISAAGGETDLSTWRTDQQRELAEHGGGAAWLAYRFGVPVAAAGVWRDGAGVAVVDDVVTHAVHRRLGIASHLVAVASRAHRQAFPDDRLLLLVEHATDAERLYARLGFAAVATVWGLTTPGSGADGRR
ncbi:MAG: GNAT family N-acetyltransferase [Actinobacteria bacterium]|nr:GNAT family N-acetyltransferase [Actinomycetota bacterium]